MTTFSNFVDRVLPARILSRRTEILIVTLLSMACGAAYAFFAGQDVNWDWQNYHDYDAFALMHGRYRLDVAPAGIQTFINPFVYIPTYLLRHHLHPITAGLILGAVHGLNIVLLWGISRALLGRSAGWPLALAATVVGATAPLTLSEVGTSFADLSTSILVLAGVWMLLGYRPSSWRIPVGAGCLIGAAVGLKLTNMCFAIGAIVLVLGSSEPVRQFIWFAAGGIAGAVLMAGPWAAYLFVEYRNPLFPYFNAIFRSSDGPPFNINDPRFLPKDLKDALKYPIYWLLGINRTAENPFRDGRFAVLEVLILTGAVLALLRRARDWGRVAFTRTDLAFFGFYIGSFAIWMLQFSYQRYAIALEMLTGPAIVLFCIRLLPDRYLRAVTFGLAGFLVAWTQPPDWWHRPWSNPYLRSELPPELQAPATYFFLTKPLAFIWASSPRGSLFYGINDDHDLPINPGGELDKRIREGLGTPLPAGDWAVELKDQAMSCFSRGARRSAEDCRRVIDLLKTYGLERDARRSCVTIPGVIFVDAIACPLRRAQ